jgi:hypothetical protein
VGAVIGVGLRSCGGDVRWRGAGLAVRVVLVLPVQKALRYCDRALR